MISIVICSVDDTRFDAASRGYARLLKHTPFEILRIRDAKCLAEGYNRGLAASLGDPVIFSHDDIEFFAPDFARRLLGHMEHCDLLGAAGTRLLAGPNWTDAGPPYLYGQVAGPRAVDSNYVVSYWSVPSRRVDKMEAVDGMFLCVRRNTALMLRFDHETYDGFHLYDIDFSYRASRAGMRVAVACDLCPFHLSHGSYGPEWERYAQSFRAKTPHLPAASRAFTGAALVVSTREQAVAAMMHAHWDE